MSFSKMAGRLNWQKASMDSKVRTQGSSPHEDLLPRHPEGDKLSPKVNHILGNNAKKKKKTKPPKARKYTGNTKHHYLKAVVSALVRGEPQPKPFKKLHSSDLEEIQSYSSRLDWARAQSEFDELERQARSNVKEKRNTKSKSNTSSKPDASHSQNSIARRIKFLRSEISKAQEFINSAKDEIERLSQK